jgi:hypothetical protein
VAIEAYDRAVDSEMEREELELRCAWHQKYFGVEKVMREGCQPASHGICEECRKIFIQEKSAA